MNLISYQTANFGPNGQTRPIGAGVGQEESGETGEESANKKDNQAQGVI